jgi:hypothetical protein
MERDTRARYDESWQNGTWADTWYNGTWYDDTWTDDAAAVVNISRSGASAPLPQIPPYVWTDNAMVWMAIFGGGIFGVVVVACVMYVLAGLEWLHLPLNGRPLHRYRHSRAVVHCEAGEAPLQGLDVGVDEEHLEHARGGEAGGARQFFLRPPFKA